MLLLNLKKPATMLAVLRILELSLDRCQISTCAFRDAQRTRLTIGKPDVGLSLRLSGSFEKLCQRRRIVVTASRHLTKTSMLFIDETRRDLKVGNESPAVYMNNV